MSVVPPGTPGPDAPAEPLISVGTITALAAAVVAALVAFGVHMTDDQRNIILTLIGIIAPLIVTVIGRTKVFSPKTVRALITEAVTKRNDT